MNFKWGSLVIVGLFLTAASCGSGPSTKITNIAVGREVDTENRVTQDTDIIPASTKTVYLSGRVDQPTSKTKVQVAWTFLPNTVIATESFNGYRSSGSAFEFDNELSSSYFASQISRTEITWDIGEYRADVYLNGSRVSSRFFKIVADSDADTQINQAKISAISFGSELGSNKLISAAKTKFSKNEAHIYTQIDLTRAFPGTDVEVVIRYLRTNQVINNFAATAGNETSLIFDLPLSRFGSNWSDRLWGSGGFEAEIRLNGTMVATKSFIVD